jgi:hypothetical protein
MILPYDATPRPDGIFGKDKGNMDTTTLLIIILVVLVLLGGGWYGRGRWRR